MAHMITGQKYSRAPITEAIIDLRVEARDGLTLGDLERCQAGEEAAYPTKTKIMQAISQLQLGGPEGALAQSGSPEQVGLIFKSRDEKQIFQVQREGFTLNRLGPYPGWLIFRDEARRLWNIYRRHAQPRKVLRMAVRYINRLDFPGPRVELKQYLKTAPEVSGEIAQVLGSFVMQLSVPQNEIRSTLQLTEASVPSPGPDTVSNTFLSLSRVSSCGLVCPRPSRRTNRTRSAGRTWAACGIRPWPCPRGGKKSNRPDCPIEVFELKSLLPRLSA
jgi:uncharacterized protein (TIGR04255 family)